MKGFPVGAVLALYLAGGATLSGQTVEEIIAKHIEASGGQRVAGDLRSQRSTGTVAAYGTEAPLHQYRVWPNLFRSEVTMGDGTFVQLFDGSRAWASDHETLALSEASPSQAEAIRTIAGINSFWSHYSDETDRVELGESREIEGRPAYHLVLALKDGRTREVYIDQETFLMSAIASVREAHGQTSQVWTFFEDYRDVDGFPIAFTIETRADDSVVYLVHYQKVEINVDLDTTLFVAEPSQRAAR